MFDFFLIKRNVYISYRILLYFSHQYAMGRHVLISQHDKRPDTDNSSQGVIWN